MRVQAGVAAILLLAGCGCAQRPAGTLLLRTEPAERPTPNLVLGAAQQDVVAANGFGGRRDWPTSSVGYVLDDTTFLCDVQFDDQYFYDRLGGYSRLGQTVRTAVTLR